MRGILILLLVLYVLSLVFIYICSTSAVHNVVCCIGSMCLCMMAMLPILRQTVNSQHELGRDMNSQHELGRDMNSQHELGRDRVMCHSRVLSGIGCLRSTCLSH